jgi:hypothetical protein
LDVAGTLSLPHHVCEENKGNTSVRHCLFKHKYISQPTVTPSDAVVKALQDLVHAIKGKQNVKGATQFYAIARLQEAFLPGQKLVLEQYNPPLKLPTQHAPRVQHEVASILVYYDANPRVPMDCPRVEQQVPNMQTKKSTTLIVEYTPVQPSPSQPQPQFN